MLADAKAKEPGANEPETDRVPVADPIAEARVWIDQCKKKFDSVEDFTCVLHKRERVGGRLTDRQVLQLKVRTAPFAVYIKFVHPNAGREAIYYDGYYDNKLLVHDVGIGKLLAGTLKLDPRSRQAMEGTRHPVTEASLGYMIKTIHEAWSKELRPADTKVEVDTGARVGDRPCVLITTAHAERKPGDIYHSVHVYIDRTLKVPIRFEAYDFPRRAGMEPELAEEFTYENLRLNVGLTDGDFDPANPAYDFGRF
jgi:hypothetical protein